MTVLDSSALLAYLNGEPGHQHVVKHLDGGIVSAVNWSEVCQKVEAYTDGTELAHGLIALGVVVSPYHAQDAELTAALYTRTHKAGLSLADRACLALGLTLDDLVLTADRAWHGVIPELNVEVIRR